MSRRTALQVNRLTRLLYIATAQRRDNCAGCRHSSAVVYDHSLQCALTSSPVSGGAVCAAWKPVARWVPAQDAAPEVPAPEPVKAEPAARKQIRPAVALGPNSVFALAAE